MITIKEQLLELKELYKICIAKLYQEDFNFKLFLVYQNDSWYEQQINFISVISSAFDHSIMEANPRRAMKYYCILYICISDLEKRCKQDYLKFFEKRLIS